MTGDSDDDERTCGVEVNKLMGEHKCGHLTPQMFDTGMNEYTQEWSMRIFSKPSFGRLHSRNSFRQSIPTEQHRQVPVDFTCPVTCHTSQCPCLFPSSVPISCSSPPSSWWLGGWLLSYLCSSPSTKRKSDQTPPFIPTNAPFCKSFKPPCMPATGMPPVPCNL